MTSRENWQLLHSSFITEEAPIDQPATNKKHCHRNKSFGEEIFSDLGASDGHHFLFWSADVEKVNRNRSSEGRKERRKNCRVKNEQKNWWIVSARGRAYDF